MSPRERERESSNYRARTCTTHSYFEEKALIRLRLTSRRSLAPIYCSAGGLEKKFRVSMCVCVCIAASTRSNFDIHRESWRRRIRQVIWGCCFESMPLVYMDFLRENTVYWGDFRWPALGGGVVQIKPWSIFYAPRSVYSIYFVDEDISRYLVLVTRIAWMVTLLKIFIVDYIWWYFYDKMKMSAYWWNRPWSCIKWLICEKRCRWKYSIAS